MATKTKKPPAAAPAEVKKDAPVEIKVVYVGINEITDTGKLGVLVMTPEKFEEVRGLSLAMVHGAASLFEVKKTNLPRIAGGLYKTHGTVNADGRVIRMIPELKWTGEATPMHSDQQMEVQAAIKALEVKRRMERQHVEEGRRDLLAERLRPLHRLWLQTDSMGRTALEALVLRALRGTS